MGKLIKPGAEPLTASIRYLPSLWSHVITCEATNKHIHTCKLATWDVSNLNAAQDRKHATKHPYNLQVIFRLKKQLVCVPYWQQPATIIVCLHLAFHSSQTSPTSSLLCSTVLHYYIVSQSSPMQRTGIQIKQTKNIATEEVVV